MSARSRYPENVRRISVHSAHRKSSGGLTGDATLSTSSPTGRGDDGDDGYVRVAVRCRPMSEGEIAAGYETIVDFESDKRIVVHDVSETPSEQLGTKSRERHNVSHVYDFDRVLDFDSTQRQVYESVCKPIVESALEGYNGTIFVYGQTGTGKTYTMEGLGQKYRVPLSRSGRKRSGVMDAGEEADGRQEATEKDQAGIIPRTFEQIFDYVAGHPEVQFLIRASYLEIYQEEIRDLLRKDKTIKLELHERPDIGVYVKDLTSFVCKSISEIERVMRVGNQNRIVGATDMNERSSRSHAIFMITIEQQQQIETEFLEQKGGGGSKSITTIKEAGAVKGRTIRVGKLNLIDLAGSERQRKTNTLGQRQKESIKINLSLSALGNVINSLMKAQQQQLKKENTNSSPIIHTPYRDSKLTRLLQDSLGGNAKTLMIANIGPASYNYDETINTLNYASRARRIRNKPRLNEDPKDALLRQLQLEIEELRAKLAANFRQQSASEQSSGVSSAKSSQSSQRGSAISTTTNSSRPNPSVERELLELRHKLASLEGKLLNGDKQQRSTTLTRAAEGLDGDLLKGLTRDQGLELERRQQELARQVARERAIRDELERREEAELLAKQSFSSVQQEVDAKRRLIRQVLLKVKSLRDELYTSQQAYRIELDELEQLQLVLRRELKLKCLIMDNFVPNEHVDQLLARIVYDDWRNLCYIEPLELPTGDCCNITLEDCGKNSFNSYWRPTYDSIRPKCEFERISEAIYPNNIRYKYEDLIEPRLEFLDDDGHQNGGQRQRAGGRKLGDRLQRAAAAEQQQRKSRVPELQALIDEALDKREPDIVI